ncbi:metallophosphoesterase family protein [Pedobacter sp.]|uniref:metallophosphoesterase family protein n=1 Tax=Pedobacter sp. TaxID=1411316 RepID=UPI003BA97C2F
MNVAIISDIHSNHFALKAVLDEFDKYEIRKLIILGDIFGYYPWAVETFSLLEPYLENAYVIKGNHDELLLEDVAPTPPPSYWDAAKQNEIELKSKKPDALLWLDRLSYSTEFKLENIHFRLYHGTPDDPKMGRYYPDDSKAYDWDIKRNEIMLLGHTHYPLLRESNNGVIFNPGSVGQPRDGNPMPSWGIFDTEKKIFKFVRTKYDNFAVMNILSELNWESKAILSLNKNKVNNF